MSRLTRWMDRTLYPRHGNNWDDTAFRERIQARLRPEFRVLDFGAGRGNVAQMRFKGEVAWVAGADVDPAVLQNPHLDEARVIEGPSGRIPYDDASFDVVFTDNVVEHLEDPERSFREIRRVLRPGGCLLVKTPNRWHYMPIVARFTPTWFHRFYNRLRGRDHVDTFPTKYRCNTRGAMLRCAAGAGFEVVGLELMEGRPEYLRLSAPTYLLGWLYERGVNAAALFEGLRSVLIVQACKGPDGDEPPRAHDASSVRGFR